MQLVASWRDSLTIFKPSNLKLFVLVTLKSLLETYKVWLKYWWWLIGLFVYCAYQKPAWLTWWSVTGRGIEGAITAENLIIASLYSLVYATLFLSVRSSVHLKNYRYFVGFVPQIAYLVGVVVLMPLLRYYLLACAGVISPTYSGLLLNGVLLVAFMLAALLMLFFPLFLFDSDGLLKNMLLSLWRTLKMVLYNLPACVVGALLYGLFGVLISMCVIVLIYVGAGFQPVDANSTFSLIFATAFDVLLFLPLLANIAANFYIKRVHEQWKLYFGEK